MKFKSKIGDGAFIGLVVFSILILSMYIYWVISGVWWPAVTLSAIMIFVVAPIYFGTSYDVGKDNLKIYCGIFGKCIPYNMIVSATDADSLAPSFALSHKRICIRYLEDDKMKYTFVSPANREQFRNILNDAISKSVINPKKPETKEEKEALKAVERAKEQLANERMLTRAEERAVLAKQEEEQARLQAELAKEIKKLDDVIAGNVSADEVVLSKAQEDTLAKRKNAEKTLYKRVEKAKQKRDKEANKKGVSSEPKAKELVETEQEKQARIKQEKENLKHALENAKPSKAKEGEAQTQTEPEKKKGLNKIADDIKSKQKKKKKIKKVNVR